ncbi:hypothetical protein RSOL_491080 [Rhizoctonia solani AG-3 Rhs1AP]|uniref:Transmembrane protein n=2 Tax=Rhizoctonia solani AG-3 TaxID=1086053 RepID=A0A074SVX5_9AGAM|nr:hypothetical protein RSOL_491080 [Rhizoctonia solani AG-3 Rhs1AP]KEP54052.1 hypothetical protein V565_022930 [Rhizoctonia solani 123E]
MIRFPRQTPALAGSVALMAFAAVSAPSAIPSHSPSPARTNYKAPGLAGHSATSYSRNLGKGGGQRDISFTGPGHYKSQGPFALKGWSAHGIAGSRVNRRYEW